MACASVFSGLLSLLLLNHQALTVNPRINLLQPYPSERLRHLLAGVIPPSGLTEIRLAFGEPQHDTPPFIKHALAVAADGLASYPAINGGDPLREAIAAWIGGRYGIPAPNASGQVLPVNGSREALFAFAQCIADPTRPNPLVLCTNPFYQIYEGAAYLAGLSPIFLSQSPENGFAMDFDAIPAEDWRRVQLAYVCSPGNPTGKVMTPDEWQTLFALSDEFGFVIASDECYSEIYFDEAAPPLGGLQAARLFGRNDYRNLVTFSSLSKRSNAPGLRSGFVAGDAAILEKFHLYRTYHGCAMNPAVQQASIAAWSDEAHVRANRALYREKLAQVTPLITGHLETQAPDAGFYLWARTPIDDEQFARELYRQQKVTVLPGSYLSREHDGTNPGAHFVRIALVPGLDECRDAARRIGDVCRSLG